MQNSGSKALFKKISKTYDEVHGSSISLVQKFSQEYYYYRCSDNMILDLGNGGQSPTDVLGENVLTDNTTFVGLDPSIEMLKRKDIKYNRIAADGLHLPFKDNTFDYVIINGVFHHLGFSSKKDQFSKIKQLLNEALRICVYEIIVNELFVSRCLEMMERQIALLTGYMPTFVLSEYTFDIILRQISLSRKEVITKILSDFTGPFYWYQVIMDYEWLKVPAFLSPFKQSFFVISPNMSNNE